MKNELVVKVIGFKWESAPEQKEEHIWISDACFLLITLSYYTIWSEYDNDFTFIMLALLWVEILREEGT